MSDLDRLRRELANRERAGKRTKAELAALRAEIEDQNSPMTRAQELQVKRYEQTLNFHRKAWKAVHTRLAHEEARLATNPDAMLRFS